MKLKELETKATSWDDLFKKFFIILNDLLYRLLQS